jgi:DNA-binding transcriptional LysR family regulator
MERLPSMDLTDIRAFARIAELGSISAASRALPAPKANVSRSLVRLEHAVGAKLIERSTRQLRLTDAGLVMQRHARRILDEVGEAENAIGSLTRVPSGTLRVCVPFTFATGLIAHMLPEFLARYPDVRLVLSVDNRLKSMLAEELDVSIRIGALGDDEMIARKLATITLRTYASPAYLTENGTPQSVNDLVSHRLIASMDKRYAWKFRSANGVVHALDIVPQTVVREPMVALTMLIAGAGIARLPDFLVVDALADGTIVRVLPDLEGDTVDAYAIYPSHRSLSPKVVVFVEMLAAHLSRLRQHSEDR